MDEGRTLDDLSLLLEAWAVVVTVSIQVGKTSKHQRQGVGRGQWSGCVIMLSLLGAESNRGWTTA